MPALGSPCDDQGLRRRFSLLFETHTVSEQCIPSMCGHVTWFHYRVFCHERPLEPKGGAWNGGSVEYSWPLVKRFAQFAAFDSYLRQAGFVPPVDLPPKTLIRHFRPTQEFADQRARELRRYLTLCLQELAEPVGEKDRDEERLSLVVGEFLNMQPTDHGFRRPPLNAVERRAQLGTTLEKGTYLWDHQDPGSPKFWTRITMPIDFGELRVARAEIRDREDKAVGSTPRLQRQSSQKSIPPARGEAEGRPRTGSGSIPPARGEAEGRPRTGLGAPPPKTRQESNQRRRSGTDEGVQPGQMRLTGLTEVEPLQGSPRKQLSRSNSRQLEPMENDDEGPYTDWRSPRKPRQNTDDWRTPKLQRQVSQPCSPKVDTPTLSWSCTPMSSAPPSKPCSRAASPCVRGTWDRHGGESFVSEGSVDMCEMLTLQSPQVVHGPAAWLELDIEKEAAAQKEMCEVQKKIESGGSDFFTDVSRVEVLDELERTAAVWRELSAIHKELHPVITYGSKGKSFIVVQKKPEGRFRGLKDVPFTIHRCHQVIGQVLQALELLHKSGVAHGHLSQESILVDRDESNNVSRLQVLLLWTPGQKGQNTKGWATTRGIRAPGRQDQGADLWALACVVLSWRWGFELAHPWSQIARQDALQRRITEVLVEQPPQLPKVLLDLHQEAVEAEEPIHTPLFFLAWLLTSCFATDPARRPSASELLEYQFLKLAL